MKAAQQRTGPLRAIVRRSLFRKLAFLSCGHSVLEDRYVNGIKPGRTAKHRCDQCEHEPRRRAER